MTRRSNQPVYWALFGAGGMMSALFGAGLAFMTGIAIPEGIGPGAALSDYDRALAVVHSLPGRLFLFAVVTLFLWHAAHRVHHTLPDFGLRQGTLAWLGCYGVALAGTLVAVLALFVAGF